MLSQNSSDFSSHTEAQNFPIELSVTQDFEPEFLCDALGELSRMIDAEASERKRRKMARLRDAIAESELHRLYKNKEHGSPTSTRESDDL